MFSKTQQKTPVDWIPPKEIYQMSMSELRDVVGDFGNDYDQNNTGEMIRNDIFGYPNEGFVRWCEQIGVIKKHTPQMASKYETHAVVYPVFLGFKRQYDALKELRSRTSFAEKEELKRLEESNN